MNILSVLSIAFMVLTLDLTAQQSDTNILERLREKDQHQLLLPYASKQPIASGYRVAFTMTTKRIFASDQGLQISAGEAVWTRGCLAMKLIDSYERQPRFRPKGTEGYGPVDYDANGNLILWRTAARYLLTTKDRNESLSESVMYKIGSNDQIIETNRHVTLSRFSSGDLRNSYLFDQFQQATGWGFAGELGNVISYKPDPGNPTLALLEAERSNGSGKWTIVCERGENPLVREATLLSAGIAVTNFGLIAVDGLRIAESGSIAFGAYSAQFHVLKAETIDSSKIDVDPLYIEILNRLAEPFEAGSEEIDFRGQVPKRVFHKSGASKGNGR